MVIYQSRSEKRNRASNPPKTGIFKKLLKTAGVAYGVRRTMYIDLAWLILLGCVEGKGGLDIWHGMRGEKHRDRSDVLREPSDTFTVSCKTKEKKLTASPTISRTRNKVNVPCLITTLHIKTSIGRMPSNGTLPLPVVWYRPN